MTTITVTPTNDNIFTALRSFLTSILPSNIEVVMGQLNRVPEVKGTEFVVLTIIRQERLATNRDQTLDVRIIGAMSAGTLLVNEVNPRPIQLGTVISGVDVPDGTTIDTQMTGDPGEPGAYTVSSTASASPAVLGAGYNDITQNTEITIQADVHSDDMAIAGNYSEIISTLFRDEYATNYFDALGMPIEPLYASDPRQMPFLNDAQQYESRFVVELCLQANQTVRVPQQFMDSVDIGLIEVDSHYPP